MRDIMEKQNEGGVDVPPAIDEVNADEMNSVINNVVEMVNDSGQTLIPYGQADNINQASIASHTLGHIGWIDKSNTVGQILLYPSLATAKIDTDFAKYENSLIWFIPQKTNTDTVTVALSNEDETITDNKPLLRQDGSALEAGDITDGALTSILFSIDRDAFVLSGITGSTGGGTLDHNSLNNIDGDGTNHISNDQLDILRSGIGGAPTKTTKITSSQAYIVTKNAVIELVGGGGGAAGGGGGGGGYSRIIINNAPINLNLTIGLGGLGSRVTDGGVGGNTVVSGVDVYGIAYGGGGGDLSGGDSSLGYGGEGNITHGGDGTVQSNVSGGQGGSSGIGGGEGSGGLSGYTPSGQDGTGGGGGGAGDPVSGSGGGGFVIITEYQ